MERPDHATSEVMSTTGRVSMSGISVTARRDEVAVVGQGDVRRSCGADSLAVEQRPRFQKNTFTECSNQ